MKRASSPLLLTFIFAAACSSEDGGGGPRDASVALPDANVILPSDAGIIDATTTPTVTAVTPRSGPETGGTRVVVRGSAFLEPAEVFFGDRPATSVVVLDDVSIAATTPPHPIGSVTVRVTTPGGTAALEDAYRYHRELVLTAVQPTRLPEEGGVPVTIVGRGFDADTLVLFERRPLLGARLVDAEHIEGFAPALPPGRPEIRVMHREAEARRSDLVVVFATPEIRAVAPGFGPVGGGAVQALDGDGLEDAERVLFGAGSQGSGLERESRVRLSVTAPVVSPGIHDVAVATRDALGTLVGGYVAYDPARTELSVVGVAPRAVPVAGGDLVSVVGTGFPTDAVVTIGGRRAALERSTLPHVLAVRVPAGLSVGPQAIAVRSRSLSDTATLAAGLVTYAPMEVTAIVPSVGPASGGTEVRVTGRGFVPGVEVRVGDVPLADVVVVSGTELTGRTVAGAHGPSDVRVSSSETRAVLEGAFRYEEPFSLIRVEPSEGSIAGNTYVSVFGRGIDAPVSVAFGAADGLAPLLENGSVIGVRTRPSASREVDVVVRTRGGDATFRDGYFFYDPTLVTGGAWGGRIEGSVNVAVLDPGSGRPIPGMVVQLGHQADPRYRAVTDEDGLATISSPEIRGAQTITAGQNGFEFVTFTDLDTRNLTMFSDPHPASPPPDSPVQPCPQGQDAPIVRGKVYRVKSSLDPVTSPGWIPVVRVTYSQATVFSPNPPSPAEQADFVFQDGGDFEIVVLRGGAVAVYGILYDYNEETQQLIPRRLGIARQVPAAPGSITEGVRLELDIELDQTLTVRLDGPPIQSPGPTLNAVFPFLNLGSEGVIPFQSSAIASGPVVVESLPDLAASQFFYMGGSFTSAGGGLGAPYSLTLYESGEPFDRGLELGPFVQMPEDVAPKPGEVVRGGRFSWDQAGVTPDITTYAALDFASIEGRCCLDRNMNGQCDPGEAVQEGSFPQQFVRWSLYAPGGLESYVLPPMPSGLNAFDSPNEYGWNLQQAVAPRFDWREFVYNQFSPFFWTSWSVWGSTFVSKEETFAE